LPVRGNSQRRLPLGEQQIGVTFRPRPALLSLVRHDSVGSPVMLRAVEQTVILTRMLLLSAGD
jgi:hypothetical protein